MRYVIAIGVSVVAAALAPTVVFEFLFLIMGTNALFPLGVLGLIFCVSLAHTVVLGLPAMLILLRIGRFGLWQVACCGFAAGSASMAGLAWPPTNGWSHYLQALVSAGASGVVSATAFYFTFKGISPNKSFESKSLRNVA
jgi:hypothetical protein